MRSLLAVVVLAALLATGYAVSAAEVPQSLSDDQVAAVAAKAPACPAKLDLGLKTRLIDFIDCTSADDPHDFKDQGTSKVVTGPAGTYRITAAHRHAFFSYRFRSAGKDKPVLIVWEYPDDADRTINFSTHESALSGRANADWSLETGVYTGEPYPLTKRMQYHTFIMYCQDQWPCVLVGNFHRYGHPAAASRIWVYAIEGGLPKLKIDAPEADNQRVMGHYNSIYFLPTRFHFGLRSPNAIEHMLDYCQYMGINLLSWGVITGNGWAFAATVPAWGTSDRQTHLDDVLKAMDARDAGFGFVAAIALQDSFKIGGKAIGEMSGDELRPLLVKGFEEFVDHYGKFKSLKGIALGGQYGIGPVNLMDDKGVLQDVVSAIKAKRPDLHVMTYVGGKDLHREYFDGNAGPSAGDVVTRWEASGQPWSEFLGDEALRAWKKWKIDPATLGRIKGLMISEQYQPDDNRIYANYDQQPRSLIYHDLDCSQRRSDHLDSTWANLWNTHYEGWYGLNPKANFWYQKHWVAPDFNPPPPLSQAPFTRTLAHRDRMAIVPGSWNNRYFGWEASGRKLARAFRSLPPVVMNDVATASVDTVKVRWVAYKGKRYVAVISLIPFDSEVAVDGKTVKVPPYELITLVDDGTAAPVVRGTPCAAYREWVAGRIATFRKLHAEVKALNPGAAPKVYMDVADKAASLLAAGKLHAADVSVGAGLIGEMQLRKDILDPPQLKAARIAKAPPMNGNLDAWPKAATDTLADGGQYLAGHTYFPNSWAGPDDLSARIRLAHDGKTLYVGVEVRDSVLAQYEDSWNRYNRAFKRADGCSIRLSTDGAYLDWISPVGKSSNVTWPIAIPFDGKATTGKGRAGFAYTCRRTDKGYVFEGSAPLADLKLAPGGSMGFLLSLSDVDKQPNVKGSGWAAKQAFLVPHKPNYAYWNDVRNCGRLVLE